MTSFVEKAEKFKKMVYNSFGDNMNYELMLHKLLVKVEELEREILYQNITRVDKNREKGI